MPLSSGLRQPETPMCQLSSVTDAPYRLRRAVGLPMLGTRRHWAPDMPPTSPRQAGAQRDAAEALRLLNKRICQSPHWENWQTEWFTDQEASGLESNFYSMEVCKTILICILMPNSSTSTMDWTSRSRSRRSTTVGSGTWPIAVRSSPSRLSKGTSFFPM